MSPLVVLSVLVLIASIIILILRALYLRKEIQTANRRTKQHHHPQHGNTNHNHNHKSHQRRTAPISTVVVLGSGGHTTEMLQLLDPLNPQQYTPLTFIVAQTDTTSLARVAVRTTNTGNKGRTADTVYRIPRSREVGQSYVSSIATTLWSLIYTLGLVVKIRPGLLLINGPGTCLPIAVWTFVGRLLGLWEGKIIFCESFCRVTRYVIYVTWTLEEMAVCVSNNDMCSHLL
jgi:beta-1,4-N-acetylglucosaminyltransferase